jgi:succinate dehydrogenase flavin-adding protein (antitoxin of CptAB toxin-antitoxin module)
MSLFDIVENDMFDATTTEEKSEPKTVKERLQELNKEEAPKTLKRFFEHIDKVSPDNKNELKRLLEQ